MDKQINPQKNENQVIKVSEQGFVNLPFSQDQLKNFIVGLLGKPQTVTKSFTGRFIVRKEELINLHSLINQRINQQNNSTLLRVNIIINYSDDSSIILRSIDELIAYNETKSVISRSVTMSWQYLITFNDKDVPERQSIDIDIVGSFEGAPELNNYSKIIREGGGIIHLSIKHTARTWASDIENLLTNHFHKLIEPIPKFNRWFKKHQSLIATTVKYCIVASAFIFIFIKFNNEHLHQKKTEFEALTDFFKNDAPVDLERISAEIEFVSTQIDGPVESSNPSLLIMIVLILFIGIISTVVETLIEKSTAYLSPSFVVMNEKSKKFMNHLLKKEKLKWAKLIGNVIIGILTGLLANYLFLTFFT